MTDKTCITLPPPRRNSLSLSLRAALLRFSLFFSSSFSAPTCVHVRLDIHTPPPPPDAVLSQGAALHRCPAWRYTSRNSNFIVIFINWVARVNAPAVPPDGLQLFVILKFNAALRVPSSPHIFAYTHAHTLRTVSFRWPYCFLPPRHRSSPTTLLVPFGIMKLRRRWIKRAFSFGEDGRCGGRGRVIFRDRFEEFGWVGYVGIGISWRGVENEVKNY